MGACAIMFCCVVAAVVAVVAGEVGGKALERMR